MKEVKIIELTNEEEWKIEQAFEVVHKIHDYLGDNYWTKGLVEFEEYPHVRSLILRDLYAELFEIMGEK